MDSILNHDLELSEPSSDEELYTPTVEQYVPYESYRTRINAIKNNNNSTYCHDELPVCLQNRNILIYSIYNIFN